jgi:hypothetical protein
VQMAEENRAWVYRRIQGALFNLGHDIARRTIADILHRHGLEPPPERSRKTTLKEFLTQHWELIAAADVFPIEAWTPRGLQRFVILFFMELSTRKLIRKKGNDFFGEKSSVCRETEVNPRPQFRSPAHALFYGGPHDRKVQEGFAAKNVICGRSRPAASLNSISTADSATSALMYFGLPPC